MARGLASISKIQEEHEKKIHGRKAETYPHPIHFDTWSEVQNAFIDFNLIFIIVHPTLQIYCNETLEHYPTCGRDLSWKITIQEDHEIEIQRGKAETCQSPIHFDKRSETLEHYPTCGRDLSSKITIQEDHEIEIQRGKAETCQSPIHFDKRSEALESYTTCARCLAKFSKIQEDLEMEIHGRKAKTFPNSIHSDTWSEVQNAFIDFNLIFIFVHPTLQIYCNQFQVPEKQTIPFGVDLHFSIPVIPLTPCTIPSVVKDENGVEYRDQADRSQMVTDMPEVLDTHLTKDDVDRDIPQNNWREIIFNLRWKRLSVAEISGGEKKMEKRRKKNEASKVHQVIFVFLLMILSAQAISTHCETSRTMNCTQLFLTCSFDTDIIQLAKNLYMIHVQNNSVDFEIILACQKSSKGFHCETSSAYEFVSVESNRLTVKIPEINLEHFGKYWCNVQGFVDIVHNDCQLSLPDTSSEDCFQQENGPSGKDDSLSPATIAIIILGTSLVLVGASLIIIWFRSSGSTKNIATCFNIENCKSGRSAPTTNAKEECEKL